MKDGGLTERHALPVVAMSASSLRYQSAPDRNIALRSSILSLAHRHRRYGAGMIISSCGNADLWSITSVSSDLIEMPSCRCASVNARRVRWVNANRSHVLALPTKSGPWILYSTVVLIHE